MRLLNFLITTLLGCHSLFGQIYTGTTVDKIKSYNCLIRINKDSTVNFIYDRNKNGMYGEHKGTIKRLNDTTYHISAVMTVGQFYMKAFHKDTIYIQLDSNIARQLDVIEIEYSDKVTREQLQGYDRYGKPIRLIKVPANKHLFNKNPGTDYIKISINRKNQVTEKWLSFIIPYGSAASFTKGRKIEFDIVIKNGTIWTIGNPPLQTGDFKLKKKSST